MTTTGTTTTGGKQPGRRRRSPVYVDRAEVKEFLGIAENRTLAKWVEQGWCPPPNRWLTPIRPVWMRKEFESWVRGRGAQSASEAGPANQ